MKLSRYEQESILNYNAGEQTATLYTRDKAVSSSSSLTGNRGG